MAEWYTCGIHFAKGPVNYFEIIIRRAAANTTRILAQANINYIYCNCNLLWRSTYPITVNKYKSNIFTEVSGKQEKTLNI